jgi:hypothetical protein
MSFYHVLTRKSENVFLDASRETESFSLQKEERVNKTPSCRGARLALIAIVRPYPLWVPSAPLVGLLLPFVGPFAALFGLFSGGSHGWFTSYVNRLRSFLCFSVCVCGGVPGGLSSDRCGFVLVLGEIFNSKGCLVGGGHGSSSHLELILTIPLTIWG